MKFTFIFSLLLFHFLLAAQSGNVIFYQPCLGSEHLVIDESGKIAFILPAGHSPELNDLNDDPSTSTFFFYDFANGPMMVVLRDSFYMVDQHGKWVAGFSKKKYHSITRGHEGVYIASYVDRSKGTFTYVFLDSTGSELFGGKIFDFATDFNEGLAIVDPVGDQESWQIISTSGEKIADFTTEFDTAIISAKAFSNGLALVTTGTTDKLGFHLPQKDYYFDRHGQLVIDLFKALRKTASFQPRPFYNDIACYMGGYDLTFFNKDGKPVGHTLFASQVDVTDSLILVTRPFRNQEIKEVYDHALQKYPLPQRQHSLVEFALVYNQFIGIISRDTLTKEFRFELYNPRDGNTIYSTPKKVFAIKNGYVLIGQLMIDVLNNKRSYRLLEIDNLKNEVLFKIPPDLIQYTDFGSALPNSEKVKLLKFWGEQDLAPLCKFPNLTKLDIGTYNGSTLPTCDQYVKNLKEFGLSFSPSVEALPKGLIGSSHLERLSVLECPNVSNLEQVIESCKNLKSVILLNMPLDSAFIERMKIKNPGLNLGGWHSVNNKY